MKISKHSHSCLLVQEEGKVILIDPGNYTYENHTLEVDAIPTLDMILYTHEHPDHFFLPLLQDLLGKFPNAQVISNKSIVSQLATQGIVASAYQNDDVKIWEGRHEKVFGVQTPVQNAMMYVFHRLLHPGDSLSFSEKAEILALPMQAPWGSLTQAMDLAVLLKPKIIIPIHDWHWKDVARKGFYQRCVEYLAPLGISFKALEDGEEIDV